MIQYSWDVVMSSNASSLTCGLLSLVGLLLVNAATHSVEQVAVSSSSIHLLACSDSSK
jgi:hypothetical protein